MNDEQSENSVASYTTIGGEDGLVKTIYKKLAHEGLITTGDHIEAADALCKLQNALEQRGEANRQSQLRLICVMTSLSRRAVRMDDEIAKLLHYAIDKDEVVASGKKVQQLRSDISDLEQTATLVFVVIVMLDVVALGGTPVDPESPVQTLDDAMDRCLWTELCRHSKRKLEIPEEIQYNEKQRLCIEDLADRPFIVNEDSISWSSVMFQPGILANAAVRASGSLIQSNSTESMAELTQLARVFAQSTCSQMAVQMLRSERDFLSLSTQRIRELPAIDRENALLSIACAAESEAGQSVLRDLILSFLLPRKVIGVRRTLLLSREMASEASKHYPWVASLAHEVAMQGAEWVYRNSKSELKRTCALLAGIAMLTTSGTDDFIRKATAFNGLVQLPFLETVPPVRKTQQRLALIPTTRSWVLYTLTNTGRPVVELSQRGFDGLVNVAIAFRETV